MSIVVEEKLGGVRIVGSGGGGKGGGGSARTPVESPDSLHNASYAAVLDIISNGETAGPAHPDSPLRDIYLDGTPIQNADGSLNFTNVKVEYRVGTVDQEHIPGFPASANVTGVNREVKTDQPFTQLLTNPDLSAVRVSLNVPRLVRMVDSGNKAGDRVGYKVEYAIDLQVFGGTFKEVLKSSFDGKTINGYTRTHRIELPADSKEWTIRVRRLTPETTNSAIEDKMFVQSFAEVVDGKFRHPMTALVGIMIDAEQFQSIPARAYRWRGMKIRVPSNYDPVARTYSGVWDGTFKRAWSNNPAWIYYDMLTSKLYGLGDRIDASMIDRYALYQIAAYCDQQVPDGMGGQEPRFTCNVYLQTQADALRVLNDLTSTFRGMAYWANGQVVASADMPSDKVFTYNDSNVVDGRFEYTGADLSTLKTVALVSWTDPSDFYRQKVEVVNDDEGIRRYGIRKTELVAFGCDSRGQAQRVGLYHLYTSRMETGGVAFSVGLDGEIPQPGKIVEIADNKRAGRDIGGRIKQATTTTVTLDRDHPIKKGDRLTVNLPTGVAETRPVSLVSDRVVSVSPAFSISPSTEAAWSVSADDLVTQLVRVISIKESDGDGISYDIAGVLHHPGKFAAIDTGVRLDPLPVSVVPPRVQTAPTNIQITQHHTFHQGVTRHSAEITWDASANAVLYDVQWRRDNSDWINVPRTGTRLVELSDIHTGIYQVRARAVNSLDVPSLWAYSDATTLDGLVGAPATVTGIITKSLPWAIEINWSFPSGPNILERTEVRYSTTNSFEDSVLQGEYSYPTSTFTQNSLKQGAVHFFWARLIDKNGEPSAWFPASDKPGIRGVSSSDAVEYNELLTLEILESALGEQIWDGIESLPDIRENIIPEIQAQIDVLSGAQEWDSSKDYLEGSAVFYSGKMYRAKLDVPAGITVSDEVYWQYIGDYESVMGAVAALSLLTQENTQRIDGVGKDVTAVAESASSLLAAYRDDNDFDPLAAAVNEWDSRAWIHETNRVVATEKRSQAEVNRQLGAQIGSNTSLIQSIETVISTDKESQALVNRQLQSDLTVLEGVTQGQAQTLDEMQTSVKELDGVVTSEAGRTTAVVASLRDDADPLAAATAGWDTRAWIHETNRVVATEKRAQAEVNRQIGSQIGDVAGSIQEISASIVDLEGAVNLTHSVRLAVDSKGNVYAAGYGIGLSNESGVMQSQFVVLADRFAVMHAPNGTPQAVLTVQNGVVMLNEAMIGNATINAAKFTDWLESAAVGPGGVPALRLNFRTGEIQMNALQVDGSRVVLNNRGMFCYDGNGVLRYEAGFLF